MKRSPFLLVTLLGCASGQSTVVAEDALAPGLRAGPHEVQLNGARHFYRVGGVASSGAPPVVFLHGGPGQGSEHFDALVGSFMEPRLRMVYFDQRGSGHSERPASGDYALGTLVDDVEALRRELGVPKIAVVGHSFGGLLALEYAAKYPASVSHVVFVAGLWDTRRQCQLRVERLAQLRPDAYARVRGDTIAPDGTRRSDCDLEFLALRGAEREKYNSEAMFPDRDIERKMDSVNAARGVRNTGELGRALFSAGLLTYRFQRFDRLTMPVLVIAGKLDGAAQPRGLRELAETLPNARFVEFDRSGHFVYLDEPERFAREVSDFILGR
ncbi:MAG TPA: alpha/beta hydrolase [Gemmatimonadaceae bacterium]|nr:alpha/beta hydrolase [Gemmatimonadaceae bacterium]